MAGRAQRIWLKQMHYPVRTISSSIIMYVCGNRNDLLVHVVHEKAHSQQYLHTYHAALSLFVFTPNRRIRRLT